jgi:threonine/homoserine/homoserine lactone efflux protein
MSLSLWFSLAGVCLLGAMSPGPSLALVVRYSISGGSKNGVAVAISHGVGVFCWALATSVGIGILLANRPELFVALRVSGALFLLYLGGRSLLGSSRAGLPEFENENVSRSAFFHGFLVAATNPKIAFFFLALFSQFVRPEAGWPETFIMATTAGVIDALWYSVIAVTLSARFIAEHLKLWSVWIDRVFGVILTSLALSVLLQELV